MGPFQGLHFKTAKQAFLSFSHSRRGDQRRLKGWEDFSLSSMSVYLLVNLQWNQRGVHMAGPRLLGTGCMLCITHLLMVHLLCVTHHMMFIH